MVCKDRQDDGRAEAEAELARVLERRSNGFAVTAKGRRTPLTAGTGTHAARRQSWKPAPTRG